MSGGHIKLLSLLAVVLMIGAAVAVVSSGDESEAASATGTSSEPLAFIDKNANDMVGKTFYMYVSGKLSITTDSSNQGNWQVESVTGGFNVEVNGGTVLSWPSKTGTLEVNMKTFDGSRTGTCTINVVEVKTGTASNPLDSLELCIFSFMNIKITDVTPETPIEDYGTPSTFYVREGAKIDLYHYWNIVQDILTAESVFEFKSVSSGYGLTANSEGDVSGYASKTGTISFGVDVRLTLQSSSSTSKSIPSSNISTIVVVPDSTPVTSVSISGSSTGEVGDRITLTATTSPSSADNRHVEWSITSGSSRAEIVSTTDTTTGGRCVIELTGEGSVTVRATASDGSGEYDTQRITITNPEVLVSSVSITGSSTVNIGSSVTLTATTSPSTADDRSVYWEIYSGSSNAEIVSTTDTTAGGTCVIKGLSAGSVTVRAYANDSSGEYDSFTMTVVSPDIEITSAQGDCTVTTGSSFAYVVSTNVSGCTVSITGADWLSVSGDTVYGVPSEPGDYAVDITVSKPGYNSDTQSFTIKVVSSLGFTSVPSNGLIVVEV